MRGLSTTFYSFVASLEPFILKGINHAHSLLTQRQQNNRHQEVCFRIRTGSRGGIWVVGRCLSGRYIYAVIEKCDTMNDMSERLLESLDKVLGKLVI